MSSTKAGSLLPLNRKKKKKMKIKSKFESSLKMNFFENVKRSYKNDGRQKCKLFK